MSAIVTIKGVITSKMLWKPDKSKDQKGDPHLRIDILQIAGDSSDIVTIRDDKVDTIYKPGDFISIEIFVSHFKQYLSFKVFRGDLKAMKLQIDQEKPQKAA